MHRFALVVALVLLSSVAVAAAASSDVHYVTDVHFDRKTKVTVGTDQMTLKRVSLYITQAVQQTKSDKEPRVIRGPLLLRKDYAHKVLVVLASSGNGTLEKVRVIGVMDEPEYP